MRFSSDIPPFNSQSLQSGAVTSGVKSLIHTLQAQEEISLCMKVIPCQCTIHDLNAHTVKTGFMVV